MKRVALLYLLCMLAGQAAAANPVAFQYAEGQTALRSEVRDPCIIREGDTYYLTFTMWPFRNREEKRLGEPNQGGSPGVALYASRDLKTWSFSNTWFSYRWEKDSRARGRLCVDPLDMDADGRIQARETFGIGGGRAGDSDLARRRGREGYGCAE